MPVSKILNPKNDFAFKKLFGTSANADLTLELLNHALDWHLDSPIVSLQFPNPQQLPQSHQTKDSYLDVLCVDAQGQHYIIEMQVAQDEAFRKRAQYYAAKAFCGQLSKGEPYRKLSRVILLAFTDFLLFPGDTSYKSDHLILDARTHVSKLQDIRFTFIDLTRFKAHIQGKPITQLRTEEKWYLFLKEADQLSPEALANLAANDPIMARLQEQTNQYYWSPEELALYNSAEKRRRDQISLLTQAQERGLRQGMEKGMEKGMQAAIARLAQRQGISLEEARHFLNP